MRILYVENQARFAALAAGRFLAGHSVTVVPTVAGARAALLAATGGESFDAALVDYDLDDGKGTEVVAAVRALERRPLPRVIAVSSHAEGNAALRAAGADAVCAKADFALIQKVLEAFPGS